MFTRSPLTGPSHKPLTGKHRTVRSTSATLIDVNDSRENKIYLSSIKINERIIKNVLSWVLYSALHSAWLHAITQLVLSYNCGTLCTEPRRPNMNTFMKSQHEIYFKRKTENWNCSVLIIVRTTQQAGTQRKWVWPVIKNLLKHLTVSNDTLPPSAVCQKIDCGT